jgi:hypothetical protein
MGRGEGTWRLVRMIDVLGLRAPFVGMGIDAQLLEDQEAVGKLVDRVPGAKRWVSGGARYALSVALRSVPRFAITTRPRVTVRNLGSPAIEMAKAGATGNHIATGEIVWTGDCTLVAAATIPFFGFGLKMFAFSTSQPDRFHLRCGDTGLFEMLRSIPAAFRGDYFSEHVRDFLCDRVAIEVDGDAPVEVGGELIGRRDRVELAIAAPITVITLGSIGG